MQNTGQCHSQREAGWRRAGRALVTCLLVLALSLGASKKASAFTMQQESVPAAPQQPSTNALQDAAGLKDALRGVGFTLMPLASLLDPNYSLTLPPISQGGLPRGAVGNLIRSGIAKDGSISVGDLVKAAGTVLFISGSSTCMHTPKPKFVKLFQDTSEKLASFGVLTVLATYEGGQGVSALVDNGYKSMPVVGDFPDYDESPIFSRTGTFLIMTHIGESPYVIVPNSFKVKQTNDAGLRVTPQTVFNSGNLPALQAILSEITGRRNIEIHGLDPKALKSNSVGCTFVPLN